MAEPSLRFRIVAAHALLAVGVCGLFAVAAFLGIERIEAYLVQRRLELVVKWQSGRSPGTEPSALPTGLAYFGPGSVDADTLARPAGFYEEDTGAITVYTLIVDDAAGRHVAVDRVPDFELIERDIAIALAVGTTLSVALAALLGGLTAGRVIAPLTALADAVKAGGIAPDSQALTRGDEIGSLGRVFVARAAQLEALLDRERAFSGDASHELRTPLAVIAGAAEILSTHLADRPAALPVVERIQRTAAQLSDRVTALLELSRAPGELPVPQIDLRPLVDREADRCRALLVGKNVTVVVEGVDTLPAAAHPELVSVAIGNLLRNACVYTEEGRIVVRLDAQGIVIEDSGPGLPPDVRERLFARLPTDSRDVGRGAGFGLALVKRIVDHLGWSVCCDDSIEHGSRFAISLPQATSPRLGCKP